MPNHLLQETNPLREFESTIQSDITSKKEAKIQLRRLKNLNAGMKKVRVHAQVLKMFQTQEVYTRLGTTVRLQNIIIGDEGGTIKLTLWNEHVDTLHVGDRIEIDNAKVVSFRGERQLRISRGGTLRIKDLN